MIKAKKGSLILLGLSDTNIERLKKGQPIKFNLQELGLGDYDVLIFYGKDEQSMQQELKEFIHPFKTIITDSRAKEN
jgi:hypothetical protein